MTKINLRVKGRSSQNVSIMCGKEIHHAHSVRQSKCDSRDLPAEWGPMFQQSCSPPHTMQVMAGACVHLCTISNCVQFFQPMSYLRQLWVQNCRYAMLLQLYQSLSDGKAWKNMSREHVSVHNANSRISAYLLLQQRWSDSGVTLTLSVMAGILSQNAGI